MKSQWFNDKSQWEFAKLIEDAGGHGGYRTCELFSSFLFCAYASLRQPVEKLLTGSINPEIEAEYLREIKRFKYPEKICEAMARLVIELERQPRDFLGAVYSTLGLNDKDFSGQCFTPMHVCTMMAKMTMGDAKPDPEHRLTVCEPAVGGGAMVIAVHEELKSMGFGPRDWFL